MISVFFDPEYFENRLYYVLRYLDEERRRCTNRVNGSEQRLDLVLQLSNELSHFTTRLDRIIGLQSIAFLPKKSVNNDQFGRPVFVNILNIGHFKGEFQLRKTPLSSEIYGSLFDWVEIDLPLP